jgi:phenylalanine-4-hydroxylase
MKFVSRYQSYPADEQGFVNYRAEDDKTWSFLYQRQIQILPNRAVPEFIQGLEILNLNHHSIPQIPELNQALAKCSKWQLKAVDAVISSEAFFTLLSQAYFPVATFIRRAEDMDYITEPDVFHEIFGHVPLLTQVDYGNFIQTYAKMALSFPATEWNFFLRLFWFTIEFGLIETDAGLRIYGGGILSSYGETMSALVSDQAIRAYFDPTAILRTPYRIDQIQPLYYVIKHFSVLQEILTYDFATLLARVHSLGMFPALFPDHSKDEPTLSC